MARPGRPRKNLANNTRTASTIRKPYVRKEKAQYEPNPPSSSFKPSEDQIRILDWIRNDSSSAIVNAVAGSGKTTALWLAAWEITRHNLGSGIALSFMNSVQTVLQKKLAGTNIEVSGVHKVAFRGLSKYLGVPRFNVKNYKYDNLIQQASNALRLGHTFGTVKLTVQEQASFCRAYGKKGDAELPDDFDNLIDLARAWCLTPESNDDDFMRVCDRFELQLGPMFDLMFKVAREILRLGLQDTSIIDYTDMLWMTFVHNVQLTQHKWVFVDECQDLSPLMIDIVRRCLQPQGRLLAVGDPYQAIMGFAGADSNAFWNVRDSFGCIELPLSVCYRCPRSVLALARRIVSQIQDAPNAIEGEIDNLEYEQALEKINAKDFVICRKNAPLLRAAYRLLARGLRARVMGADFAKGLVKIVSKRSANFSNGEQFEMFLTSYREVEYQKLVDRYGETKAKNRSGLLDDKIKCLQIIATHLVDKGLVLDKKNMRSQLETMFDASAAEVLLSSVHRAKGGESHNVFILEHDLLGQSRKGADAWQTQQEKNLHYVALTRAQNALYLVEAPEEPDNDETVGVE